MSEARPSKIETVLRRWPLIVALLLILTVIVCARPLVQKHRFIQRYAGGLGLVESEPGWLREKLPQEWQDWLVKKTGVDWLRPFEAINRVSIQPPEKFTEEGWIALKQSTRLKYLSLEDVGMTDSDLIHLKNMSELKSLSIHGNSEVTDAGLAHVEKLSQLEELDLEGTKVTDSGLAKLKGMTNLKYLSLWDTDVTDTGLGHLSEMTQMESLRLENTNVTDAGLTHLSKMTNLRELYLQSTDVSGSGLKHLRKMTQLENLFLSNTNVTDAGLSHLKEIKSLRYLFLYGTKTTPEGAAELKAALPDCSFEDTAGNFLGPGRKNTLDDFRPDPCASTTRDSVESS